MDVTLDKAFAAPDSVSISSPSDAVPAVSENTANIRSEKAAYGLGDVMSTGKGEIKEKITSGKEAQFRTEAAGQVDREKWEERQKQMVQAASTGFNDLNISQITAPIEPTDPDSVIEDTFARKFVDYRKFMDNPWYNSTFIHDLMDNDPERANHYVNLADSVLKRSEFAQARAEQQDDHLPPWYAVSPWQHILRTFQTYQEYNLRGLDGNKYLTDLLGTALDKTRQEAYKLPYREYKDKISETAAMLQQKDPWLASVYLHAMAGNSSEQIKEMNVASAAGTAMDASLVASPLYSAAKGVVRGMMNTAKTVNLARTMVKAANEAVAQGVPADVAKAAAIGDLETAAVKAEAKTDNAIIQSIDSGKVTDEVTNKGLGTFQTIINLGPEPRAPGLIGNLGSEIKARLRAVKATYDWVDRIRTLRRVDEGGVLDASEIMNQIAKEEIKNRWTGPNSHVFEVGDLVHVDNIPRGDIPDEYVGTNVRFAPIRVGDNNGAMFTDELSALNHADRQGMIMKEGETTTWRKASDRAQEIQFEIDRLEHELGFETTPPGQSRPSLRLGERRIISPHPEAGVEDLNRYHDLTEKLYKARQDLKDAMLARAQSFWHPEETISATPGWAIKSNNLGVYLEKWVPVDYYGSIYKNSISLNPLSRTPMGRVPFTKDMRYLDEYVGDDRKRVPGFWEGWKSWIDTPWRGTITGLANPAKTMSKTETAQRVYAVHNPQRLMEVFEENSKALKDIPGHERITMGRILQDDQTRLDAQGRPGAFYDNTPDFENQWFTMTGRFPSAKAVDGYFAYKNNIEMDRGLRSIMAGHIKMTHGVGDHAIWWADANGKKDMSPRFEAIPTKEVPSGWNTSGVVILHDDGRKVVYKEGGIRSSQVKEELREKIKNNEMTGFRIWNPEINELNDWFGAGPHDHIQYVYAPNADSQLLDMYKQIPQRGGGHWIYEHKFTVAQAKVQHDSLTGAMIYKGDNPAVLFHNEAEADRFAKHMTKLSKYFAQGGPEDVLAEMRLEHGKALHEASAFSDWKWDDIKKLFDPAREDNDGKKVGAYFNTREPFRVKPSGSLLIDLDDSIPKRYGDAFIDGTKQANPARMAVVKFTQERDSYGLLQASDVGTKRNPAFKFVKAPLLDPMSAMTRGINEITNSLFMSEMKDFHINQWLRTAAPFLKQGMDEIEYAPYRTFLKPVWKIGAEKENLPAIRILEGNRAKIQQLIGLPNDEKTALAKTAEYMANTAYNIGGGKVLRAVRSPVEILPDWAINTATNPLQAIRSLVFGAKMGFFNPASFWKQAATFSNVIAQSPAQAHKATFSAMAHEMMSHLPESALPIMESFAQKIGYKPGEWTEAYNLSKRISFIPVKKETAYLEQPATLQNPWSPSERIPILGKIASNLTEKHTIFFQKGAEQTRAASFYSAVAEWRAANPTGPITRLGEDWISNRAAKLDHWMSRAWNSTINTGKMSAAGQFYTYARNVGGIMTDPETSPYQRAMMMVVNGTLWGLPAGAMGLFGVPYVQNSPVLQKTIRFMTKFTSAEGFRQWALENGYVPGSNPMTTFLMEGGFSTLAQYISGGGDFSKGTSYNVKGFGSEGYQPVANFFNPTGDLLQAFGASYNFSRSVLSKTAPFYWWALAHVHGKGDEFPIKTSDLTGLLKDITVMSRGSQAIYAAKTGELVSNNGALLKDKVSWGAGLMNFFFGINTNDVSDIHLKSDIREERQQHFDDVRKAYMSQFVQGLTAIRNGNIQDFKDYSARAKFILQQSNLAVKEQYRIQSEMADLHESLIESINDSMWQKMVPADSQSTMLEAHKRIQQMKSDRGR